LGFILKEDVGFWVKNEGWGGKVRGLGKIGNKKSEKK
jgi:hypothetical protein